MELLILVDLALAHAVVTPAHAFRPVSAAVPSVRMSAVVSGEAMDAAISELMLEHDPLLHWARRLMPARQNQAASALYAWCRRLDEVSDAQDVPRAAKLAELDAFAERFDALWRGESRDAMDAALAETLRAYPQLGRRPFDEMLLGMRSDVASDAVRYDCFRPREGEASAAAADQSLLRYCYRAAGTVGEMLLPVLGLPPDGEVAEAAVALGCAIQLLNIVRDVRLDVKLGRVYIPLADMRALGVSVDDVRAVPPSPCPHPLSLRRCGKGSVRPAPRPPAGARVQPHAGLPPPDAAAGEARGGPAAARRAHPAVVAARRRARRQRDHRAALGVDTRARGARLGQHERPARARLDSGQGAADGRHDLADARQLGAIPIEGHGGGTVNVPKA